MGAPVWEFVSSGWEIHVVIMACLRIRSTQHPSLELGRRLLQKLGGFHAKQVRKTTATLPSHRRLGPDGMWWCEESATSGN